MDLGEWELQEEVYNWMNPSNRSQFLAYPDHVRDTRPKQSVFPHPIRVATKRQKISKAPALPTFQGHVDSEYTIRTCILDKLGHQCDCTRVCKLRSAVLGVEFFFEQPSIFTKQSNSLLYDSCDGLLQLKILRVRRGNPQTPSVAAMA